jgi:hypothetical protein
MLVIISLIINFFVIWNHAILDIDSILTPLKRSVVENDRPTNAMYDTIREVE